MPSEKVAAFDAIDDIAARLDAVVAEGFARARASDWSEDRPACRRGCAFCCHQLVPLTTPEAQRIADYLSRKPRAERRQIGEALERQARRFAAWVQVRQPKDVLDRATNLDYLRQRIPCPFLGPENECRVYPVRPLICRGHHALGTSAHCETGEQPIRTIPTLDRATSEAVGEARAVASALGLSPPGGLISTFAPLFRAALRQQR
jgi:Fe-S-cluster containining protein